MTGVERRSKFGWKKWHTREKLWRSYFIYSFNIIIIVIIIIIIIIIIVIIIIYFFTDDMLHLLEKHYSRQILGLRSAYERRRYTVTTSLIGRIQA